MGDHIRKRRLDLHQTQREVAATIGVDETTIHNWEGNTTTPDWHYWRELVRFLAYDPFPAPTTLGQQITRGRKLLGLSQRETALRLGVDPSTLGRWERFQGEPQKRVVNIVSEFLREIADHLLNGTTSAGDTLK